MAAAEVLSRLVAPPGFVPHDSSTWGLPHSVAFALAVVFTFEALTHIVPAVFSPLTRDRIPARGKHHDVLDRTDLLYLTINRALSIPFTYHYLRTAWVAPFMRWSLAELSVFNTLLPLPLLFLSYDFAYSLFHRALHHQSVYRLVHKHHHRQHAPSRGNTDAVNVHPFEFVVGEYLHLAAVLLVGTALRQLHGAAVLAFIVAGGVAASLNHTRLGVTLPLGLYDVRAHDVHHRMPKNNYGQYTMAWDHIFGTFREYSSAPQSPGPSPMKSE